MLKVDDEILFESSAIAEYLDEVVPPRLHPEDPIARAKNRAWTDFTPSFAGALSKIHYAKTREGHGGRRRGRARCSGQGRGGPRRTGQWRDHSSTVPELSLVDAAYAPFLQRYLLIDDGLKNDVLRDFPLIRAWAETLMADERVTGAVPDNFEDEFHRQSVQA